MKKKYIGRGIIAFLLFIQLFQIDKSAPEVDPFKDLLKTSQNTIDAKGLIDIACYDCHSYRTEYPWYALFAPVSWWMKGHVNGGREHLNFSLWQDYDGAKKAHKLEECIEEVEGGNMPLKSYTWMHPPSKLSAEEREKVIAFFKEELRGLAK